jgi:hypothetical protein
VYWSGTGTLVAIVAEDSVYILRFDRDAYEERAREGDVVADEGVEEAFDVVTEISDVYAPHLSSSISSSADTSQASRPLNGLEIVSCTQLHPRDYATSWATSHTQLAQRIRELRSRSLTL